MSETVMQSQAPLIYAESYTPTMKFYTIEEGVLDSLSTDNDRAIRSRSLASGFFGGFIMAVADPLIFMGMELSKLTPVARFVLFFGAPMLFLLSLYWFWDSHCLFVRVDSNRDKIKTSVKTGYVEVRPLEENTSGD